MIILEIVLVTIGLAAVVVSYRMADAGDSGRMSADTEAQQTSDEQQIEEKMQKVQEKMEASIHAWMQETEDALSKLSNDKLMGMDDYSSQVLKKIEQNHEEVVFLYNMLNEKEDALKELIHTADKIKAQLQEQMAQEYQKNEQALEQLRKTSQQLAGQIQNVQAQAGQVQGAEYPADRASLNAVYDREIREIEKAEQKEKKQHRRKKENVTDAGNHNARILQLYKEGYSILDISKMLSLGQGEVEFVLNLNHCITEPKA